VTPYRFWAMGLVHSFCRFLSSQLRLVWPKSLPPSPSAEPRQPREPVTALGLFNQQMVLYTYADGEVVGIDSSTRQVLFRDCLPREILCQPCSTSLPCVAASARECFVAEHLEATTPWPAVIKGATERWKAIGKWDLAFFERTCGNIQVEVTLPKGHREFQPLGSYLQSLRVKGQSLPYLRGWYYEKDAPWLAEDLWQKGDFHDVFQDWFKRLPPRHHPDFHWLFIGAAGAITPLHIDPSLTHAWLTQISGRKRFTLFAPWDIPELLSNETDRIFRPLKDIRASNLPGVKVMEVILEPGDTIFVPAMWPHEVECLDASVSVTWNFLGRSSFPLVRAAYLANSARRRET